jgi:para-nitrobenzyl esterase
MIIGNTHDETRAFMGGDPTNFTVTWAGLPAKLGPGQYAHRYRRRRRWWRLSRLYPHYSPSEVLFAATTAARSWRGAIIEAEQRAPPARRPSIYQLDWARPKDGGKLGAP